MTMLKADLQDAYDRLTQERDDLLKGQAEFLDSLVHIAGQAAAEHELCGVLEETLAKIGIDVPTVKVSVVETTTKTYEVPVIEGYRLELIENGALVRDAGQRIADRASWDDIEDYIGSATDESTTVEYDVAAA